MGGGLNAFYLYQIFVLDSAVVEDQEMFSSHGGHLTNAMYLLTYAIFISILQVLKKGGIYREYTCFL